MIEAFGIYFIGIFIAWVIIAYMNDKEIIDEPTSMCIFSWLGLIIIFYFEIYYLLKNIHDSLDLPKPSLKKLFKKKNNDSV